MDYAVNIMDYLIICYCFASLSCLLMPIGLINTYRSEQHNLADTYPDRVAAMVKEYEAWAERSMVVPAPR